MRHVFLNPKMRQIDAEGEKDKQTAQELEAAMAGRSRVVEALVPRACGKTGGWPNRLDNGNRLRDSISGVRPSICVHLFNLRMVEAKLL